MNILSVIPVEVLWLKIDADVQSHVGNKLPTTLVIFTLDRTVCQMLESYYSVTPQFKSKKILKRYARKMKTRVQNSNCSTIVTKGTWVACLVDGQ